MPRSPRARRWTRIAAVLAVALLVLAWWVSRQLESDRLARTVLARAGAQFQLDMRFDGRAEYALRPEPRLLLREFSAGGKDGKVFLSAQRLEISLPWSTLTGGEPVVTRIELDSPRLDLALLQRWLATRPEEPFRIPTLSKGLGVRDGRIVGDAWSVEGLDLELPFLAEGQRAQVTTEGSVRTGGAQLGFDGQLELASAGMASAFDLRAALASPRKPKPLRASLVADGNYAVGDTLATLTLRKLQVKADSPLPSFDGSATLASGRSLAIDLSAQLVDWPKDWPRLPGNLAGKGANLPITLAYRGDKAFNGPLSLHAQRDDTVLDARLRLPEFLRWFDDSKGVGLPPLAGTVKTPSLELDGVKLEGVEIRMGDDEAAP